MAPWYSIPTRLRCFGLCPRKAAPDLLAPVSVANSVVADRIPTAPPIWTGVSSALSRSHASTTPFNQPAALAPKVVGAACWVRVRATMGVARWVAASSDSVETCSQS